MGRESTAMAKVGAVRYRVAMRTKTNSSNVIVWLAACTVAGLVSAFFIGYFWLCEPWGTAIFQQAAGAGQGAIFTVEGPPFLDRMYPSELYARIFSPAAKLESWLTNVEVRAVDRSRIGFDFTIDDNTESVPAVPDPLTIFESPSLTFDADGWPKCPTCQRRLSPMVKRKAYIFTCRPCKSDLTSAPWSMLGSSMQHSIDVYREGEHKPMLTGIASEIWQEVDRLSEDGNVIVMPSGYDLDD
jgi:ribosomal protein L37AE/L43A